MRPAFTVSVTNDGFVKGSYQDTKHEFQFMAQLKGKGKVKDLEVLHKGVWLNPIPPAIKPAYDRIGDALKEIATRL